MIGLFAVMKLSTFFLFSFCLLGYSTFANFGNHTPFLKSDGTVWATGYNNQGQLGDGSNNQLLYPVQVTDSSTNPITNISAISSGGVHTVFLKSDGTVWATGENNNGELGIGNTLHQNRAVQVMQSNGNPITNISAISAGHQHTVFLKNDGTVWATGYNNSGQLGIGNVAQQNRAVQVMQSNGNPITNISAIAAGYDHTVMLKNDGTVWGTGYNNQGQLGDGSTSNKLRAEQVTDYSGFAITNISVIAAGAQHTVFIKNNGTVWATGDNDNGQLGDGSTNDNLRAEQVTDSSTNPITNISAISSGGVHTVFLKNDGTVWATGNAGSGQLGIGNTTQQNRAVQVMQSNGNPLSNISRLSENSTHSINTTPTNLNPLTTLTLSENQPIGTVVGDFNATDPDYGAVLTYTLMNDNATSNSKFSLSTAGRLTTAEVLDFENNATHTIRVLVSDELNATMEGNFTVTVTNVEEAPIITFGGGAATAVSNVSENQRGAASVAATEPDGQTLTYSITGGLDAALFTIDSTNGELSFVSTPDYEFPTDSNQNNSYEVDVRVVDTAGNSASQSISVVVQNMIDLSTFIFSNAGATGRFGPTQAQVDATYTGTDLAGKVTINTQGIQEWIVPFSGMYSIEAWGAQGGYSQNGGNRNGARIKGELSLIQGTKVLIAVGQMGASMSGDYDAGSGGGTFVASGNSIQDAIPLIIAGGGSGEPSDAQANPGSDNEYPTGGISPTQGLGYGGGDSSGPGGGGWLSDGYNYGGMQSGGRGFKNSAQPLIGGDGNHGDGGFGGGSGGMDEHGTAGGGYTGGTGRDNSNITGGGGSYNSGTNQVNLAGANAGHGKVIISALNTPPSDITLSEHNISENLSIGSIVGTFSTTDPDDTNGTGIYAYQLIIDPNKTAPPLNLDTNGTLTTTSIFNFESEGNYSIRVKTSDSNGASFEKDFVIYVIDEFPPYVETGNANLGSDGRYTLYGTVVDEGGISGILERGFVISSEPITHLLDSGITKLVSTINNNNFSSSFTPTLAGKKHYFRAYAINAESDFLGTEETFTPVAIPGPGYWSDAKASTAGANWWESSWFGSYYSPDDNQWIMHSELGWLFPSPSMDTGVWFWKDGLKWLWTDSKTFPFLHSIDQGSWLYFYGNVGEKRLFYAYASQKWIVLENGVVQENTNYSQNPDNPDLAGQQAGTITGE